jgi:hypothetical protein
MKGWGITEVRPGREVGERGYIVEVEQLVSFRRLVKYLQ